MAWKFKQIKPQKARGKLAEYLWGDPNWSAEVKHDGDRRIAQFCPSGLVRFTGTRQSTGNGVYVEKTANLPHLQIGDRFALEGTVLDGEIVAPHADGMPGGKSKYVTAIMGSGPEEAIRKQKESGWLEYRVFDCLWFMGDDIREMPLHERRDRMIFVLRKWQNEYAGFVPQTFTNKKEFYHTIIRSGGEGVILKHRDHKYGDHKLWVKVKGEATADVVVMGFEPGKGKYEGSVGAIKFGQYGGQGAAYRGQLFEYGTCRGFTDTMMSSFARSPKKYIGRVIEITHNGREPTGAFRHPRFKGFRDDKDPKDCVYQEEET